MSSIWRALEELGQVAAVTSQWQSLAGQSFSAFKPAFLQSSRDRANSFPCPRDCGCNHEIIGHDDGRLVAVCRCEPWDCEDIRLTAADVVLWKLNRAKLGRELCKAFGCDVKDADLGLPGTRQIGSFGNAALPVALMIQSERRAFASSVRQLVGHLGERFILLAPTNRFLDGNSIGLLKKAKAGFFDLASNLVLTPSGTLKARKSGGELFSPFAPKEIEPLAEDQARQLFALVEKLESGRRLKNPSVMEVFRLYCIKGETTDQIVSGGRYSKGTIINRLKAIRRATNKDPDELRAFSPYLQRIEETITDSRAAYIHRKALVHDNKETDDESE